MKNYFVFVVFFLMSAIRLAFAQKEAIANDYYAIEFCERNQTEDVPYHFMVDREKNPYKICDIRIVSFDSQMNCIKTHIFIVRKSLHYVPEIESYHGKIEFINDSIVSYTSNGLVKGKRNMIRAASFPCPMATLEEDFVIRSSSIRKAETWWTFYQFEDLHLKRSELRELRKILKLCGLRMKNNRIIYPDETH